MIKLRNILSEGKYDKLVLDLSRAVVNTMKQKKKRFTHTIEIMSGKKDLDTDAEVDDDDQRDFVDAEITVNFKIDKTLKFAYGFSGIADIEEMTINIFYNPAFFPMAMNDMIAELKETLRHEIEHLAQFTFQDKGFAKFTSVEPRKDYVGYLTQKHEVPAFVQGLFKRAKTKRITVPQAMEEWNKENGQNFKNSKEWDKVKKIWMTWGKKNLPNAQWGE